MKSLAAKTLDSKFDELKRPFRGAGVDHEGGMVPDPGADDTDAANQFLAKDGTFRGVSGASGGTVTSVTAGTGLDGGTITTAGTIDLADTAVTPGSYTSADITVDAQGRLTAAANGSGGGVTDHGALTGLSDDDHTQYARLAGRSGGQTLDGGTAASDDLVLDSTAHATKGDITLAPTGGNVGIGGASTSELLELRAADVATYSASSLDGTRQRIINTDTTNDNTAGLSFATVDGGATTGSGATIGAQFRSHATGAITADLTIQTRNAGTDAEAGRFMAEGHFRTPELAAPGTPATGFGYWYFDSAGLPRAKNDAGLDVDLSFSAGAYDPSIHFGGNMIANWPPITGQDDAQPEWWEEETADIAVTDVDIIGEGIADDIHKRALKVVGTASGANDYVYQRLNIADHDQLDTGSTISASIWVYITANTAKLELVGSVSGSLGSATTTTTGAWTLLKVENKTVGASDTYVDIRLSTNANSNTSYWACPMLNVGTVVRPWVENPLRWVQSFDDTVSTDPANTNFTAASFATPSHPLACVLNLAVNILSTGGVRSLRVEPGYGSGSTSAIYNTAANNNAAGVGAQVRFLTNCSDTQGIQWRVSNADVSTLQISLNGYFRFAY